MISIYFEFMRRWNKKISFRYQKNLKTLIYMTKFLLGLV